jgi:hypothetical protein
MAAMVDIEKQGVNAHSVFSKVSNAVFGKPLINNVFRGHLVEAIVSLALGPTWKWCSEDYSSWDFENGAGIKLEVKQSAKKQSWVVTGQTPSPAQFDIAARKIHWEQGKRVEANARAANIYIFAFHPLDGADADHRDPFQWEFYVVASKRLPHAKTVRLSVLAKSHVPVGFDSLKGAIDSLVLILD